jgi:hypothetical protein
MVFALGCTVEECEALTTWGYDRSLDVEPYIERQKKKITVKCENGMITKPAVIKCKSFDDMILRGIQHKQSKLYPKNRENLLIYYNISRFCKKTGESLHSEEELIKLVLNRPDAYAMQNPNGGYFKVKNPVTDSIIEKHLEGTVTIGAYQFNPENFVKWVCFDIDSHAPKNTEETEEDIKRRDEQAENDMERMCNFFKSSKVPFMLEKSGSPHSYHIWVFVNPVSGKIARQFGIDVKKETGIECEVFPKQAGIGKDGYGNLVKVPLATHQIHKTKSEIMINGEFVRTFTEFDIEILDLSNYPIQEEKQPEKIKSKPTQKPIVRINGEVKRDVRPCIKTALTMPLTSGQGHFMRMAIAREHYEAGMKPEDIAMLFKGQTDFDYDYSLYQVNSLVSKPGKRFRCDRLRADGSKFINCEGCEYLGRW